jgi:uncharacterized protein (TIGR02145 family)
MNFKSTIPIFLVSVILIFMFWNCKKESATNDPSNPSITVTDIDGNVYHTVTIGTQVWMVENLKTTKYRNGDPIPYVTDNLNWEALGNIPTGGYCWYNNDTLNKVFYGALYNWYAVTDNRNIAPAGWHVPSDAEWTILTDYLGGLSVAGGKLKEDGTLHWISPNWEATNSTGFTALPGGYRSYAYFTFLGYYGRWWSSSTANYTAWYRGLCFSDGITYRDNYVKKSGFYVRCVRD